MQVLCPTLRWIGPGRSAYVSRHSLLSISRVRGSQRRAQHNNLGPHKEYFQTPGKEPKPDLTPYVRKSTQRVQSQPHDQPSSSIRTDYTQTTDGEQQPPKPQGWLRIPRFIRSTIWCLLFLQLGAAAGTAVITWEYLSPPFEPGSPEEEELVDEIWETFNTHPMVQDLMEQQWVQTPDHIPNLEQVLKGRNLVHQTLGNNNTQGIFSKAFHHPTQEYTMLVFFFGFGVEGWPDVIHGGAISTLMDEALSQHVAYYFPDHFTTPDRAARIDFKKPCKPGEIYAVLVAPSGREASKTGNVHLTKLTMTSLLVQMPGAPVLSTQFDVASNTEAHTISIPAQRGQQPTYAVCQAQVKIFPKTITDSGKPFEVGGSNDPGFGRALDFLKNKPEFKTSNPTPTAEKKDED